MFGFLFRPKSPTRDWVRSPGLRLTFDLDRTTLNGVSLGGDFQRLSFLGPDEDRKSSRAGVFCYYSLGLCVDAEIESSPSAVTCFQLVFHDPDEDRYETFAGSVLFRGRAARLAETDVDGFVGHIGEPYWIDRDEDAD